MPQRRTALVTGASAGLGAEFAAQLAALDYNLVLVARREDRLRELAASLQARHGVDVTVMAGDLAEPETPAMLARSLKARGIEVDYLVNNAGAAGPELLEDDWDAQRGYLELMMISVAHMCHEFVPAMRERGFGRVINVASVAGRIARGGDINYASAKAYVIALSEGLACTLRGTGVNVCALCPGFVHTDYHAVAGLLEMKQRSPKFVWYNADVVVREGLRAAERGKMIQVSGRLYRLADPLLQSVWTRPLFRFNR